MKSLSSMLSLLCLLSLFALPGGCSPSGSKGEQIGPGDWNLDEQKRYAFAARTIGPWRFSPVLVVGARGLMLTAQAQPAAVKAAPIIGQRLGLVVRTSSEQLSVLQSPPDGPILTVLDAPLPMWYVAAPKSGQSVKGIELAYDGVKARWTLSEGSEIEP